MTVADAPRFRWRGAMLDVSRHFLAKREVLRFIDLMAVHRLNILHLHLTDDQGWRIEIQRYPRLTEVGGWRHESQVGAGPSAGTDGRPHGGYYTQDDIREIVAYAAERHIAVVPEIDMPGPLAGRHRRLPGARHRPRPATAGVHPLGGRTRTCSAPRTPRSSSTATCSTR